MVRLEIQAVPHRKFHARFLTGRDHLLAFGHVERHGFFTNHVFPGQSRPDGVFRMHGVGQYHVHDVDIGIVLDLLEILVAVDAFFGNIVFLFPGFCLGGGTCDDPRQAALFRFLQSRGQLMGTVITQPHQRYAEFARCLIE